MKHLIRMALAMALIAVAFPATAQEEDEVYINPGFNDTWFNAETAGQGFGISVYPESGTVFVTVFAFDTTRPADETPSGVGDPGGRWFSAHGGYEGNTAMLDIEWTEGGVFFSEEPMVTQTTDGTMLLEFSTCYEGTITIDVPSKGLNTVLPIQRPADDNGPGCEVGSVLVEDQDEDLTGCESAANKMFLSCRYEVKEELYASNATCVNLGDEAERTACEDAADEALGEDTEGCGDQKEARLDLCELLDEDIFDPEALLDADNFLDEPDDSNPYFSLVPGSTSVIRAGENFEEMVIVTVTDEVREIHGVNCRIVVDAVLERDEGEFEPVEITDDYYAQALNGDIYYCGEVARNFEDGYLVDLDGSFVAGRDGAKSGILILANPMSGDNHRQEYLPGEAEDAIQYLNGVDNLTSAGEGEGGENPAFPCMGTCVKTEEFIPPEPESGEYKYFIAGTGFVMGVALEDGEPTGERDETLCVGDSLDVLEDQACGIDAEALPDVLEQLCELSAAFCESEE